MSLKSRKISVAIMALSTLGLIVYDIIVAVNDVEGDTYSEILRDWGQHLAIFPWAAGLLVGHWFWNGPRCPGSWAWPLAFLFLAIISFVQYRYLTHPMYAVALGVICGRFAWGMTAP